MNRWPCDVCGFAPTSANHYDGLYTTTCPKAHIHRTCFRCERMVGYDTAPIEPDGVPHPLGVVSARLRRCPMTLTEADLTMAVLRGER